MKTLIYIIIIGFIITNCAWLPHNESGCRNRYAKEYTKIGNGRDIHTSTVWWTECD